MKSVNYILFSVSNEDFFIFDTYKNKIKKVDKEFYGILDELSRNEEFFIENATLIEDKKFHDFLCHCIDEGFFTQYEIDEIRHPQSYMLEDILDSNIESINLQVTQNCNFRCMYCPYTGKLYKNRVHNNKKMSIELAKKGIDYLVEHSFSCEVVNIAFYGGEPLLEMDLIEKCVSYALSAFGNRKVVFSLTTNGSLLTDKATKFLHDNDFLLTLSIDGPKGIQDKYRVFPNGEGSFDKVYRNLVRFKKFYPEYFKNNVIFNAVIPQDESIELIDDFFRYDKLFCENEVVTTYYNPNYLLKEGNDIRNTKFIIHDEYEKLMCFLYKMGKVKRVPSRVQINAFEEIHKIKNDLEKYSGIPERYHPSGPCMPGRKKLFMDVEGRFFPCERIDETSKCAVIGNVEDGINIDKAYELMNVGTITAKNCSECWAIAHCKFCFIQADDGNQLDPSRRLSQCSYLKNSIIETFKDICVLENIGYRFSEEEK